MQGKNVNGIKLLLYYQQQRGFYLVEGDMNRLTKSPIISTVISWPLIIRLTLLSQGDPCY